MAERRGDFHSRPCRKPERNKGEKQKAESLQINSVGQRPTGLELQKGIKEQRNKMDKNINY